MLLPRSPVTLLHRLGEGASGRVWAARHAGVDLPMAVKLLPLRDAATERAFRNEIESVAALDHAHVLRIHDFGVTDLEEGRTGWIATERASGGSYAERPPADWAGALPVARATLEALAHAHARGVVHRDVKPANLLECGPGDARPGPKLGDFGVAWRGEGGGARFAGTPAYLAPEAFSGVAATAATDTYAFAVTLWELVAGLPFRADSLAGWARAHTAGPGRLRPRYPVPAHLEGWLRWLLGPDRPRSAALLLRELDALGAPVESGVWAGGRPGAASPSSTTWVMPGEDAPPGAGSAPTEVWSGGAPERDAAPPIAGAGAAVPGLADPVRRVAMLPVPPSWGEEEPWRFDARIGGLNRELLAIRPPRLEGRRAERDQLWAHLGAVAREGTSRTVAIVGAPGVGRSRLAAWLAERAVELGVAWAWTLGPGAPPPAALLAAAAEGPVIVVGDDPAGVAAAREVARLARVWPAPVLAVVVDADGAADATVEVGALEPAALARLLELGLGLDAASAVAWAERSAGDLRWLFRTLLRAARGPGAVDTPSGRRVPVPEVLRPEPIDPRLLVAALVGPAPAADWVAASAALGEPLDDATVADWRRRGWVDRAGESLRVADPEVVGTARAGATPAQRRAAAAVLRDGLAADRLRLQAGDPEAIDAILDRLSPGRHHPATAAGLAACDEVEAALPPDDPRRLDLLEVRLTLHGRRGELAAAGATARVLEAAARAAGDLDRASRAIAYAGNFLARSGRLDEAEAILREALALPARPASRGQSLGFLGNVARARGDLDAAEAAYEAAHAAFVEAGEVAQAAAVRFGTAALARARGDLDRAARHLDEVPAGSGYALPARVHRALLDATAGRDVAAWTSLREACEEMRRALQPNLLGVALATAAAAAAGLGRDADVETSLTELAAIRPFTVTSTGEFAEALRLAADRLADRPSLRARALALLPGG